MNDELWSLARQRMAKQARSENVEVLDIQVHGLEATKTTFDERVLLVDEMMRHLENEDSDSVRAISLRFWAV